MHLTFSTWGNCDCTLIHSYAGFLDYSLLLIHIIYVLMQCNNRPIFCPGVHFSHLFCIWAADPRCLCVHTDRLPLSARPESQHWILPRTRWRPTASSASHLHTDSRQLANLHRKSASRAHERRWCRHTWEVLDEVFAFVRQTHVSNHLIDLLLNLFRAPALQTSVEINVLFHC